MFEVAVKTRVDSDSDVGTELELGYKLQLSIERE